MMHFTKGRNIKARSRSRLRRLDYDLRSRHVSDCRLIKCRTLSRLDVSQWQGLGHCVCSFLEGGGSALFCLPAGQALWSCSTLISSLPGGL